MTETTKDNFHLYFRDARQNTPEKGDVLACYSATAYFSDGLEKRQIIDLLTKTDKMIPCSQVMRKLICTSEIDSYRIPRKMAEDMVKGMSREQCAQKEYKFTLEMYFYAKPYDVPHDDLHWKIISLLNLDQFLAKKDSTVKAKTTKL
jgi:hypothetical protein